jgi:general secretion pathway protein J
MSLRGNDGYSLLELLVALALTAVIAAMMVQTTRQLLPLRQIQAKYDAQAVADRLTEVMDNDLKTVLVLPLSGNETRLPMIGTTRSIRFVSVVKTGFAAEGLREVSYALETEPDGTKKLVRKIALRRFGAADDPALVRVDDVFDRVGSLKLEYLGRDEQGEQMWSNRWERADELPLAIRIGLGVGGTNSVKTAALRH